MRPVKRLIVNADDLGRTEGINRGVFDAHARGIVSSASLMVNFPAAGAVAALSSQNKHLGIGLHLAFTGGVPSMPPAAIPTLVDPRGLLPAKPDGLARADSADVLAEARAQLARFHEIMARAPTHFDTHHHAHEVPAVFEAVAALAHETGLPMRHSSLEMAEKLRARGIKTPDRFVADFFGEKATERTLLEILDNLGFGTTELMCHPAFVDDELRSSSGYADPRDIERVVLTGDVLRPTLQALGIRLATFESLSQS